MSFGDSVKSVFSQYATFSGRASRSEFWWFYLFTVLVSLVCRVVDAGLERSVGFAGLGTLASLALLLPTLAVTCRRLHDSDRTGWWILGLLVLWFLAVVVVFIGGLGIVVQGLDDSGPSSGGVGGYIVLAGIGVLGLLGVAVWAIVLMTRRSTPGPNRFGPHPLDPARFPGSVDAPAPYHAVAPDAYGPPGPSPWGPPPPSS